MKHAIALTAFLCLLAGCDREPPSARPIPAQESTEGMQQGTLLTSPPIVEPNPNEAAPLAAIITVEATEDVVVALEVDDGERQWSYRPKMLPAKSLKIPLLGMRPERTHQIVVRAETESGEYEKSDPLEFVTPPLPKWFPPLNTTISQPEKMEPGVTLFAVNIWDRDVDLMDYGYMMMVDAEGEVIWYYKSDHRTASIEILENGHLLYNHAGYRRMIEINLLGEVVREWHAANVGPPPNPDSIPIDCDTLHHEILPMPDGKFLALSTTMRQLDDYYPDLPNLRKNNQADVVGDEIVEFGVDGKVLRRLDLFEHLDHTRISHGAFGNFWNNKYTETGVKNTEDWSHANAIIPTDEEDWIILSLRHQDCLVKIHFPTGEIRWILGDPAEWKSPWKEKLLRQKGEWIWPYHQHGPQLTSRGTLLMYDNGNYRSILPDDGTAAPDNFSRVLELKVDEEAMTVAKVWEYRGENHEPFYTPFYGEADQLPQTGNILITDGGHIELEGDIPSDKIPSDHQWARILEITHETPAERVWEVRIESPIEKGLGWSVYRSERIPSITPFAESLIAE
ncbi:MAG: aryl-sulfate sulfotransferase [Planctomycetaceae bacterium]|nr:aryl-sulfate sulfotransferase [Planctomycetaceae bacterium]